MVPLGRWSLTVLASAVALSLCAQQKPRSTVTLRYTVPPEEGWTYDLQMNAEETQSLMGFGEGVPTTAKVSLKTTFHLLPHPPTADTLKIHLRVDSVSLQIRVPEAGYTNDTVIMPITRVFVYALSPSGQLYSVHQERTDTGRAFIVLGEILPRQHHLSLWRLSFPKTAIPVGHQWTEEERDTVTEKHRKLITSAQVTYTLEAIVDTLQYRCARIRTERSNITLRGGGQMEFGNLSLEGSGRSQGLVYIELNTGFPVVRMEREDMELNFALQGQVELLGTTSQSFQILLQRR